MECFGDNICATKTSCPYWLGREERYKEGQDDTFIADARAVDLKELDEVLDIENYHF